MKISYDPEIDALYIRLIEGKHKGNGVRSQHLTNREALN